MAPVKRFTIVDNVQPADNVYALNYNLQTLTAALTAGRNANEKQMSLLSFLARWGLIQNEKTCPGPCPTGQMSLRKDTTDATGYRVILCLLKINVKICAFHVILYI